VLEKINFQITSVPADGSSAACGNLRHVPVSWAALWQAAACQYPSICGTEIKAQGRVENSIRVGSAGRSYFRAQNAMKVYRSPLAAVRAARAKLCGSEARRRKFRSGDGY
jgi:hypothetical protein